MGSDRKKVIGWTCTYIPEEVIMAAGGHPRRMMGTQAPVREADRYLPSNICPYVRSIVDQGFRERVDGIVVASSCNAAAHLFDAWRQAFPDSFCHIMGIPRAYTKNALNYYAAEIRRLIESLQGYTGENISRDRLWSAIREAQEVKDFLNRVYKQMGQSHLADAAQEFASTPGRFYGLVRMVLSGERDEALRRLAGMIRGYGRYIDDDTGVGGFGGRSFYKADGPSGFGHPRVYLMGSPCADSIIDTIEELGAVIAGDDLCFGSRYFQTEVECVTLETEEDPVSYLAKIYLSKPPCARMLHREGRIREILSHLREIKADGVIFHSLKFCDPYLYEYPILRRSLEDQGIPVLLLEGDYTRGGVEQARTRIGAFMEMLQAQQSAAPVRG